MRLVWVSRHDLKSKNWEILKKAFGDVKILQYKDTVNNVGELIAFAENFNADGFIVVLPIDLIKQLLSKTENKKPVYRFIIERRMRNGHAEFKPIGLERILKVGIEMKELFKLMIEGKIYYIVR